MNIKIHTHQLDMSDPLREYAERHIADVISHIYQKQAATLDIEFSDIHAGREKTCTIKFFVPQGKTLVAHASDANPYAAVDLAAEKMAREVRRLKEKQTEARHGHSTIRGVAPASVDAADSDFDDDFVEEQESA